MSQKNAQTRSIAVGSIIIVALLLLVAWLFYTKSQQSSIISGAKMELNEVMQVKAELEKEYYEALSDLEELRGNNTELNAMIEGQKEELKRQKDQISSLIQTKKDLALARSQIQTLKESAEAYLAQISQLKEDKEKLIASNELLTNENIVLQEDMQKERQINDELLTVKTALLEENEALVGEKTILARKVNRASVVEVQDIEAEGVLVRNNGKEATRSKADKIDYLKICFKTKPNPIAENGSEEFYVRIITPQGEPLAVENRGSGKITKEDDQNVTQYANIMTESLATKNTGSGKLTRLDDQNEIRYTKMEELAYTGEEAVSCIKWENETPLTSGTYQVEIYNKGYLAGQSSFDLK